jgi:hypothetical protein
MISQTGLEGKLIGSRAMGFWTYQTAQERYVSWHLRGFAVSS